MRISTGLSDEPELDPNTNFSRKYLPSIRTDLSPNVVGVLGKEVRIACYVTNLGNKTVSLIHKAAATHKKYTSNTYTSYTYTSYTYTSYQNCFRSHG